MGKPAKTPEVRAKFCSAAVSRNRKAVLYTITDVIQSYHFGHGFYPEILF